MFGFTFLNPHVYVDTVLLVGASAPHGGTAKLAYGIGAILASFVWFFFSWLRSKVARASF